MFDLEAYLARIGVTADASLAEIHRAHLCAIPFENLDPRRGVPVSLALEDLQRKLVAQRRGGYCFEHNLLLKAALEALGMTVEPFLARVRAGGGAVRPLTHLVLRVADQLVDVGFGLGGLIEPIPWAPGGPYTQLGWEFELVDEDGLLVLRSAGRDEYAVVPEPVPLVDLEVSNWFTATHPRSIFVTGLMVARLRPDGTRVAVTDREGLVLAEETPGERRVTPVAEAELPELLEQRFGLRV